DNPEGIGGVEHLAGKTVCSQEGSTSAENIREQAPEAKLVLLGGYKECADAMRDGTDGIVAVSTDDTILLGIAAESPDDFEVVGNPFTEEQYGIGVPEGQEEFCEFINEVLAEKVEDGSVQKAWDATAGKGQEREIESLEPWGCDT
ncbi:MAG TPA: transporter substrate-binding domain-containing protein, partial [Mycobacteriales bacterium]|nr:transporter substrate-binding domain-containing protein [Mycobacteriales bacterium]